MAEAIEELQFLTQSSNRARTLQAIAASGPLTRDDLEDRLAASRRTVVRIVNALTERGYVEETAEGLVLTPFGTHVAGTLRDATDVLEDALAVRPLFEYGPSVFRSIDPGWLADAEVVVASESSPFAVLDRILDVRERASRVREIAPGLERRSLDQLADRLRRDESVEMHAVLPEEAVREARTRPEYREHFVAQLAADQATVYAHPDPIDFAVGVADETAFLAVSRDDQPYALAVSTDEDIRAWAGDLFESYRAEATLVTPA